MKLVVDTNILFSYFFKKSFTKKILFKQKLKLISPEYALKEINKYQKEILKKAKITEEEFIELRKDLAIAIVFIPEKEYKKQLKEAINIYDVDFIALAIKVNNPLWSNDAELKKQEKVEVFSTNDLVNQKEFLEIIFS